jgi:tetratricopeptide (TPR) repeat protein
VKCPPQARARLPKGAAGALAALAMAAFGGTAAAGQGFAELYREAEAMRLRADADPERIRAAYGRALDAFGAVTVDSPEYTGGLPAAAFAAFMAGRYERAAGLFSDSIAAGHRDAFHVDYRLRSLAAAGKALELAAEARRCAHDHPAAVDAALDWAWRSLAGGLQRAAEELCRLGHVDEGIWLSERLVQASSRHPLALADAALMLRRVGREADSERAYREALARAPEDPLLWNDLGLLYKGAGRLAEAVDAFARSFQLDARPGEGPAITNLLLLREAGADRVQVAGESREVLPDADAALSRALALRPDAALLRRLCLDRAYRRARAAERAAR